jgi:hypothetical protein
MWCFDEYCDVNQLNCLAVHLIVYLIVSFKYLLSEFALFIGFDFMLICPVAWKY